MQTWLVDKKVEELTRLIDSGQFKEAEEVISKSDQSEEPFPLILQAEISIYFARLDEAAELLDQVSERTSPRLLSVEVAARYTLVKGELHYWRFEYEPAEQFFHQAEGMYSLLGDTLGWANAIYNLGRLKRRTAHFDAALQYLDQALKLLEGGCERNSCDYLKALIAFNRAVCYDQLGQLEKADDLYKIAIADLKRIEHRRYYALVLSSYGTLLRRLGKFEESLSVLKESTEILQGFAACDDMAVVKNNSALTLIRLREFDQAETLLRESYRLYEQAGNLEYVGMTLQTIADFYLEKGDAKQAEFYAQRAIEEADLARNDFEKAQAMISLAQAQILQKNLELAQRLLEGALKIGKDHRSRLIETAATIHLAESLCTSSPIQAAACLDRGKVLLSDYFDSHLMGELKRISQRLNNERIRVTQDNRFLISGDFLPKWRDAKRALQSFLFENALRLADGNLSRAARMLGVTTVHVHRYVKKRSEKA